ncbi:hypothetical protein AVEN_162192-1 [Araneus ventricosus]|uniref:Uncharacterized protein n=1 Tax=Araneus ventricosus TaxID=182803 RepID=A0A4Y2FGP7_ARAVE|nr:hypothetical protein AVEN_162192-1 [Araneus ventricosus]
MNLFSCSIIQMAGTGYDASSRNSWTAPAKWQIFRLVAVELWCGECNLVPLISVDTTLNRTAYINVVAEHVDSFMVIMFPYGDGHFQRDTAP